MLNSKKLLEIKRALKPAAKFDQSIDCLIVFKNFLKSIEVGTKFFKSSKIIKYLISEKKVSGYLQIKIEEFDISKYNLKNCDFYALKDQYTAVMKTLGIKIYKARKKLKILNNNEKNKQVTKLKVNKKTTCFRVCKFSEMEKLGPLLKNIDSDLANLNQNISRIYLKTTMGGPIRIK